MQDNKVNTKHSKIDTKFPLYIYKQPQNRYYLKKKKLNQIVLKMIRFSIVLSSSDKYFCNFYKIHQGNLKTFVSFTVNVELVSFIFNS